MPADAIDGALGMLAIVLAVLAIWAPGPLRKYREGLFAAVLFVGGLAAGRRIGRNETDRQRFENRRQSPQPLRADPVVAPMRDGALLTALDDSDTIRASTDATPTPDPSGMPDADLADAIARELADSTD